MTKTALLPGQATTFANYTNYNLGLNGLIVDVTNVGGLVTASDFQFATWDGISAAGFTATAATATVTVIPNGGNAASSAELYFTDSKDSNSSLPDKNVDATATLSSRSTDAYFAKFASMA